MAGLIDRLKGILFPAATLRKAFAAAEAGQLHGAYRVLATAARRGDTRAQYWVG